LVRGSERPVIKLSVSVSLVNSPVNELSMSVSLVNILVNELVCLSHWLTTLLLAYSESKYRLRIFPSQRSVSDFAHASCLPSFIGKPQTPIREKQIVFTYCSVRLKRSR
jgi:hypothetical protein